MKCEKLIKTAAVVALILFIAGAVIGTQAVPVVLSMFYSWYWLFLYAQRKSTADLLGVPVECVRAITYDQYEAATGDDETEDDDEDY